MRIMLQMILLLLLAGRLHAQDPLTKMFQNYSLAKSDDALFVHFDKNVYSNNETIYFTGYLLAQDLNRHNVLAVALVRDADSLVLSHRKFAMSGGIAFGSLAIPDSILVGSYHLLAYTNITVNGKPKVVFRQPLSIKSGKEPSFLATLKIVKAATEQQKINHVLLSVTSNEKRFLPKPTAVTYNYNGKTVTTKTDGFGQVPLQLPVIAANQQHLKLKLKYEKDSSFLSIILPKPKYSASVKFYPEGGNIINGVVNSIALEAKDENLAPVSLKAILYENEISIDTIETNSYGIGKFHLLAKAQNVYKLKLVHSQFIDSNYLLPKIINSGIALEIQKPVCNDTVVIIARANKKQNVWLRVHNFKESFLYAPVSLSTKQSLKIPVNFKGLATVTITDSLNRPLAERMIFGGYSSKQQLTLTTNQKQYQKRKKVELNIKLNDTNEVAIVSIACVQENRLEVSKMNDIQSYFYLYNQLDQLPASGSLNALQNLDYVNSILSVKGWRRYTWNEFITSADKVKPPIDSLKITGQVVHDSDKPIKKTVSIISLGSTNFLQLYTDNAGNFNLPLNETTTPFNKKLYLFIADKNGSTDKIKISDDYEKQNLLLSKSPSYFTLQLPSTLVNSEELKLSSKEKILQLKEVTITKNNSDFFSSKFGANGCGDYVCTYNILNCPNHIGDPKNREPIAGQTYLVNGKQTLYPGCSVEKTQGYTVVNGLSIAKEFYVSDYKQPEEPAYFSTLYWNYLNKIEKNKTTAVEFYTGDITGKFKIIVQGISKGDFIYQEQLIEIKE
ncbi:hypothetical protein [Nubsella zeaxanthinifaciens]|uniref:hypothetical protein n=1 Tax=Nubsella zeaxanthinifaciens TaxID=392412 RepID=UPI0013007328|nr:hypothetical protein [Nubsella zeaxanthinifaciens]